MRIRLLLGAALLWASSAWATVADLNSTYSLSTFSETELTDLDVATTVGSSADNARLVVFTAVLNNPNNRTGQVTLVIHRDDVQVATRTVNIQAGNNTVQLILEDTGLSMGSKNYEAFISGTILPLSFTTDTTLEVVGYDLVAGAGVDNFVELDDVPSAYSGAGSKFVKVNSGATALEFVTDDKIDGTGTTGRLPKFSDANTLANSIISESGVNITLNGTSPTLTYGTGAAASGAIRLPNGGIIKGRNAAGTADIELTSLTSANIVNVGASAAFVGMAASVYPATGDTLLDLGVTGTFRWRDLFLGRNALIDNQGELRLGEPDGAGSEYVSFKAPATLAASTNYTWPSDDGDANQVLSTNGSGTLDWLADDDIPDSGDFTNLALSGDISSSALVTTIGADKVLESHLKAVDAAGDEECLTYETTTGDFEWQACGSGGGYATIDDEDTPLTQRTTLNFEGAGVTCADDTDQTTCTIPGGGAGGKPWEKFTANQAFLPAASFATQDTRNTHPVLDFDAAADECAYFGGFLNSSYAGGGLNVTLGWLATSATTGATGWLVSIEAHPDDALDLDSDSFVADNSASATTASATGEVQYTTISFTDGADMDSLAAGESYRLRVCRDGDGSVVTDDMTGDAELYKVIVAEP